MTGDLPPQRPEGKILQAALQADGRSVRQVAPLAGLSEARWRQIIKGSMVANRQTVEVIAPPATLARMAYILSLSPKALAKIGRRDAAEILEHLLAEAERGPSIVPLPSSNVSGTDEIDMIYASRTMSPKQKLDAIRKVLLLRAQVEAEARVPVAADAVQPEPQDAG